MIFFGMLIVGFLYTYIFIPETKGLSLEEVDELYRAGVKPWASAGWKPADRRLHRHQEKPPKRIAENTRECGENRSENLENHGETFLQIFS